MKRTALFAGALSALLSIAPALADDWTAQQLRGQVLQLVAKQWQPLNRGDVVPDDRVIRTLGFGRVTFTRGGETIELGPNTQIQIHDRGGSKPFTTVTQYFGSVGVEAEVENVQHFAVDTPFLAAVVKGTKFVVTASKTGASVSVTRGHVAVDDNANHQHVTIGVGQSATIDAGKTGGNLAVAGSGVLPVVLDKTGKPVAETSESAAAAATSPGTLFSLVGATTSAAAIDGNGDDTSGKGGNGNGNSGNGNGNGGGDGSNGNGGGGGNSGHGHGG
jgi:hypothetical protein